MYICNDPVCDPICDSCWYCVHDDYGVPLYCLKKISSFDGGTGYCDEFKCSLHENKPGDISAL